MKKGQIPKYTDYLKAYNKKANQLAKRGYSMYDSQLSYDEYHTVYTALRNTRLDEVARGERSKVTNVMRDLVNKQAYQFTKKQAMAQHKAAEELGIKSTLQGLMVGNENLSKIIKEQSDLLKSTGLSNKEVQLIISQEYFGSI